MNSEQKCERIRALREDADLTQAAYGLPAAQNRYPENE